ncbi:hypothetical protein [Gordonia sp. KTR9]|uniref:hypothetical protein n=1 Tax=Gordonia sp. KTR9 TaxID=337191 RepID=UPI0002F210AA|nr:hypothetical protein [Gordonia sp. KTR9]
MSFPRPSDFDLVVAIESEDGEPDFMDVSSPATAAIDGAVESSWYWSVTDGHQTNSPENVPTRTGVAEIGGYTFGIVCFPAHSAGKLDVARSTPSAISTGHDGDPAFACLRHHRLRDSALRPVDIELPSRRVRTLRPGSLLVMGGVPHAWKNNFDQDCIYAAITIGATRD